MSGDARGATSRERLVEATRELLWERGYTATSPGAILRAAGVGQGSMYHHFAGKEELAAAAMARNADDLRVQVRSELAGTDPALDRITTFLRRRRDVLRGCRFGRLAHDPDVVGSASLHAGVSEMFTWLRSELTSALTEGRSSGELRSDLDPSRVAATIVATLQGGYVLARATDDVTAFDDAIEGFLDLLRMARSPREEGR